VAAVKATHNPPNPAASAHLTIPDSADPALPPSLLLQCAATYIATYGRTTGEFFDMLADTAFPPACAGGAINIAAHGRPILCADDDADDAVTDAAITAMRVFAASLDADYGNGTGDTSAIDIIAAFNDNPHTTDTDVIAALNEAADEWDRAHPAGGAQ
jgi:hypothetical protein